MSKLDTLISSSPAKGEKKKARPKRAASLIVTTEVRAVPESDDPANTTQRTVRLLAKAPNQTWLLWTDIDWLVRYVADEVSYGGVVLAADDSAVAVPNCEVPGLYVAWDFQQDHSWKATFVDGPM